MVGFSCCEEAFFALEINVSKANNIHSYQRIFLPYQKNQLDYRCNAIDARTQLCQSILLLSPISRIPDPAKSQQYIAVINYSSFYELVHCAKSLHYCSSIAAGYISSPLQNQKPSNVYHSIRRDRKVISLSAQVFPTSRA